MRKAWVAATLTAILFSTGCGAEESAGRSEAAKESPCAAEFTWDVSDKWKLAVLDEPVDIKSGGTLRTRAAPYDPHRATVSATGSDTGKARGRSRGTSPSDSEILKSLSSDIRKPLAHVGEKTSDVARKAEVEFPGSAARPVYYQGLRVVEATYRFHCSGSTTGAGSGRVVTWDKSSATTGLVDCLKKPRENPRTHLARLAAKKGCPAGSAAAPSS
ncbi:hypothetical protein DSC45_16560 [Streptomyces sp. YIM 130001]|uniref:hypothetical protein n=1 Tax=Streptomyces sp. YIM 130001 TaxID=2259644 RepID=UPI000EC0E5C1|nr:hypothetical protein [Streptomyces sp. YIM 130001]RII15854.1 hypothetical protein DSC45_16560 [Streptomyces sp. YIM 130001]